MALMHRATRRIQDSDRAEWADIGKFMSVDVEAVSRPNGSFIDVSAVDSLADDVSKRVEQGFWNDRTDSDRWIAPRLHSALRIPRSIAADRSMWEWLASTSWMEYVRWRWADDTGAVADFHWYGAVNKHALMRLWWGAELLRDGSSYLPVERAFEFQDFPNSFLHRPLVRSRSFALGILDALFDGNVERSSRDVNSLARVLNLSTAGTPPEASTGFAADDLSAFESWASADAAVPESWGPLPEGPQASDTTPESRSGGRELAEHGLTLAELSLQH